MSRRRKPASLMPRVNPAFDAAMAPLGPEFDWIPWGFISAEFDPQPEPAAEPEQPTLLDLRPDDTQFLSIRDFVLGTEFPISADRGEVAAC